MKVVLASDESRAAVQIGGDRVLRVRYKGYKDAFRQFDSEEWRQHIEGAGAEVAVAKALGLYWSGQDGHMFKGPDVGSDIQVRLRPKPDVQPDLGLRSSDDPSHRYVLVHGFMPEYELMGWCWGHEHPVEGDLIFVPVADLHGFDTWEDAS